jgi:predicted metal-dependent peptidase
MKRIRKLFEEAAVKMYYDTKNYIFYAYMVGQCKVIFSKEIDTAGVRFNNTHYELYINPDFFESLPINQRMGVLKHEMLHILNGHCIDNLRIKTKNHQVANIAYDCANNQLIKKEDLPEGAIYPEFIEKLINKKVLKNQNAEYYFDLIKEEMQCQGQGFDNDSDSDSNDSELNPNEKIDAKVIDNHDIWRKSEGNQEVAKSVTAKMIENAQKGTLKNNGDLPSNIDKWIKIYKNNSQVNWKKLLRNIVSNKKIGKRPTIMKKNRRFPHRDDLYGSAKDVTFDLLVVVDVSGSMSDKAIANVISEVKNVCKLTGTEATLIQIDTEAKEPEKLTNKITKFHRKACGGTNLYPALDKAKEYKVNYDAIIVLTDGFIDYKDIEEFKETKKKVIWLIEPNGQILDEMNEGKMVAIRLEDK